MGRGCVDHSFNLRITEKTPVKTEENAMWNVLKVYETKRKTLNEVKEFYRNDNVLK